MCLFTGSGSNPFQHLEKSAVLQEVIHHISKVTSHTLSVFYVIAPSHWSRSFIHDTEIWCRSGLMVCGRAFIIFVNMTEVCHFSWFELLEFLVDLNCWVLVLELIWVVGFGLGLWVVLAFLKGWICKLLDLMFGLLLEVSLEFELMSLASWLVGFGGFGFKEFFSCCIYFFVLDLVESVFCVLEWVLTFICLF